MHNGVHRSLSDLFIWPCQDDHSRRMPSADRHWRRWRSYRLGMDAALLGLRKRYTDCLPVRRSTHGVSQTLFSWARNRAKPARIRWEDTNGIDYVTTSIPPSSIFLPPIIKFCVTPMPPWSASSVGGSAYLPGQTGKVFVFPLQWGSVKLYGVS